MTTNSRDKRASKPPAARACAKCDTQENTKRDGRADSDTKTLVAQVAALSGNRFSAFVILAACDRAISLVHHHQILKISAPDARAFHQALENPPPAGPRLQQAFKAYKALRKPV
jgi:uncharacterized protein (DUF1778 family)